MYMFIMSSSNQKRLEIIWSKQELQMHEKYLVILKLSEKGNMYIFVILTLRNLT